MAKAKKGKEATTKQEQQSAQKKGSTNTNKATGKTCIADGSLSSSSRFPKLIPKQALSVTELLPNQIYLIPQFFTRKECQSLITYFDTHLTLETVPLTPKPGEAFRSNDRQSMQDAALATKVWSLGLDRVCASQQGIHSVSLPRKPCGLNSNFRLYRYRPGQRFEAHYDDSVKDTVTGHWTDWTLLIYLNGTESDEDNAENHLQGGETVFYQEHLGKSSKKKKKASAMDPLVVRPEQGLALLHRHGQHCLLHEALEVKSGSKWVLRSDVLIG